MGFRDVTSDERALLHYWKEEARKFNEKRDFFFQHLREAFADGTDGSHLGIEFSEAADSGNTLKVKTPVSSGRIRFSIDLKGSGLVGSIRVERAEVDSSDSQVWKQVWGFYLGEPRSIIYFETPGDVSAYQPDRPDAYGRREAFERLGRSIAYALSAGPLLKA